MPLSKKTMGEKRKNQGAQWSDHSGDGGNVHYLPNSGGTDRGPKPDAKSGNKGRELARKGK